MFEFEAIPNPIGMDRLFATAESQRHRETNGDGNPSGVVRAFEPIFQAAGYQMLDQLSHAYDLNRYAILQGLGLRAAVDVAAWEKKYGVPFPYGEAELSRLAARAGFGGETIRQANEDALLPAVEGHLLRLKDQEENIRPPEAESDAWIGAADVWPKKFTSYRKFQAFLREHPEIRTRKPSRQRLELHAGDYLRCVAIMDNNAFEALGDSSITAVSDECLHEFEQAAKNSYRQVRKSKRKPNS
jgi:hypothetical protein